MPCILSGLHTLTTLETSHAKNAGRVLQSPIPANDNLPPLMGELDDWPKPVLAQVAQSSGTAADGKDLTITYAIVAILVVIAWLYAIIFPATARADLRSAKSALALNFAGTFEESQ
jgi:hypothetical protein